MKSTSQLTVLVALAWSICVQGFSLVCDGDFAYVGCVAEGTTGTRRSLTDYFLESSQMTPQACKLLCAGYQYAGLEYG